ncbi:hypothetical protein ECZU29_56680 [Escherichia coli]|nr:hypothetical protein ECZU29_56680 [Escherichia coli]
MIEVINKILGQQQALAYDDPHGRLVIGGIGSTRAHTALVLGKTSFPAIRRRVSGSGFLFTVAGQRAGNDDDFGEATTTALRARTEDAFIARYRPMYIRQTGQATGLAVLPVRTLKPDNGRRGRMKPPMWCRAGDRVTVRCGSPTSG